MPRLAARRGARVQNPFAVFRVKEIRRLLRAEVLYRHQSFGKTGQTVYRHGFFQRNRIFVQRLSRDTFHSQFFQIAFGVAVAGG